MSTSFLVEAADGTLVRKSVEELRPEDRVVFDGPGAFTAAQAAQDKIDAEIRAAGGLEAWRALA